MTLKQFFRFLVGLIVAVQILTISASAQTNGAQIEKKSEVKYVKISPTPDWVEELSIPEFPKDREGAVQNGMAYLLSDDQLRLEDDGYTYHYRLVYEVTERTGLESAAEISTKFDPELSSIAFNKINVIRNGIVSNRLPDVEISELLREDKLDEGLIGGQITALIQLEDIRVGDIVEYSYSGTTKTPLWPGHYFNNITMEWSVPLIHRRFRAQVPVDSSFTYSVLNFDLEPTVEEASQYRTYSFELKDPEPVKSESYIPIDHLGGRIVSISTMPSWADVATWGHNIYAGKHDLPPSFETKIDKIAKTYKRPEDRIVEALRLVQNDIRYLGLENGIGSYMPREPETTVARGYGDCKDKTILLMAALRRLGIKSNAALVHSTSGHVLNQVLPSINVFNHVIVQTELDGKLIWLDPTLTYQGGRIGNLTTPDYGYALPLTKKQADLVFIDVSELDVPTVSTHETFTFLEDGDNALLLDVKSVTRNASADSTRRNIAGKGMDKLSDTYLEFYANSYPSLEVAEKIEIEDDLDANVIRLTERYKLNREDFDKAEFDTKIITKAHSVQEKLPTELEPGRTSPLGLRSNRYIEHMLTYYTPGKSFAGLEDVSHTAPGVSFDRKTIIKGDRQSMHYLLKIKRSSVSLDEADKIFDLADNIANETTITFNSSVGKPLLAKRIGFEGEIPSEINAKIDAIFKLVRQKKNVEALTALNELEASYKKADPLRGFIQVFRGSVMDDLKRSRAAFPAYEEGFSLIDPDYVSPYFSYIGLLADKDRNVEASKIVVRFLENFPEELERINLDWFGRFSFTLESENEVDAQEAMILAMAKSMNQQDDDFDKREWIFVDAVDILLRQGNVEESTPYLKNIKNPRYFRNLLMKRSASPIWPDLEKVAGADLSQAIPAYAEFTRVRALDEEASFKERTDYLEALIMASRYKDAIAFAEPFYENWPEIEAVGEDAFEFVAQYATTLYFMGEYDRSEEVLQKLLGLGIEAHDGLLLVAFGRIAFLINYGEFEKAQEAISVLEDFGEDFTSDFGKMLIYERKACVEYQLGNVETARTIVSEKLENLVEDDPAGFMLTMLCMDNVEKAKELMLIRLTTEKHHDGVFPVFANVNRKNIKAKFWKKTVEKIEALKSDPEVQTAFQAKARVIDIASDSRVWVEY